MAKTKWQLAKRTLSDMTNELAESLQQRPTSTRAFNEPSLKFYNHREGLY